MNLPAEESEFEKIRKENIKRNEEEFRKLFPAMVLNQTRESPRKRSREKDVNNTKRKNLHDLVSNLTPRHLLRRSCKREREPSPEQDTFSDEDNSCSSDNSTGTSVVVQFGSWGKRFKSLKVNKDDDTHDPIYKNEELLHDEHSIHSPRKRMKRSNHGIIRPFDAVTEADLILVADRTSDKRYDQIDGTSCHQCRQKTDDMKTACRSGRCVGVRGQFCGPCLKNRYGECAKAAIMNPDWECPPCRGICNCSFCMKKRGRRATGILIHTAKQQGFNNVCTFLGLKEKKLDS